ncbi:hypothetical protein [Mycolicibacterium vaccae]|uniref:Uncharacterized protein n=1 Tax=Mycolicibacterium vaccae ATCC 25954 TaxID=1194972 RepID=K0UGN1_MYCVA|nr:hypothetical protein [Mycolicibacterium vaccae]ANI37673.1 hypothetical protein MYVA_0404 [Mycolicibacterium vaccae 95051]EJZ05981.1 hypothetical protein MVAC_23260 [Mycolicibacterium vaccae ATCC 25954]
MAVFLRKLFRIGKLPSALRAEVEAEGVLFMSEYVAVTRRFRGAVPGLRSSGSIASYVGSLVITNERVLATLSSVPKLAGRTIDVRWDAPQSGAVKAELSETGLMLDVDVAAVDPRCSGELTLHYKEHIPADVLARLPRTTLAYDVPSEFVFRTVGVPYHP